LTRWQEIDGIRQTSHQKWFKSMAQTWKMHLLHYEWAKHSKF
jgi:hypothetical protein